MKMNNKGFAISTLIYGLSIMGIMLIAILMGIMSVNRTNNKILSNQIEEDLTQYSRTSVSFPASDKEQSYTVPRGEAGWYRIELWGAAGNEGNGGYGAYTSGVIELEEEDVIYIYTGLSSSGTGGGSTDVRLIKKEDGPNSIKSRIMVAAGGGRDAHADGGTLIGYSAGTVSTGGILKSDYTLESSNLVGFNSYISNEANYIRPPTDSSISQGGSGYFSSKSAGMGGTSYIAGYAGCEGYRADGTLTINNPGYTVTENGEEKTYYFVDGMMFPGVNSGQGKAKLEKVVSKTKKDQTLVRANKALNNVSKITDCVGDDEPNTATKISAIRAGKEMVSGTTTNGKCVTATLSEAGPIDELAVWHKSGADIKNNTIKINNDDTLIVKNTGGSVKTSETETAVGYRISAYQPNYTKTLPASGNYYLLPVLTENKVMTAQAKEDNKQMPIKMEYINGYKRQKWSIELITDKDISTGYVAGNSNTYEYKILELARFRSLSIQDDDNKENNAVIAANEFNSKARNDTEIWKITPIGNGTYTIKTVRPIFKNGVNTGNIYPKFGSDKNEVLIGRINNETQRFKLISIDYSSA